MANQHSETAQRMISGPYRRVVVTGIGVVTPLGNDLKSTWMALERGVSVSDFCAMNPSGIGKRLKTALVTDFDARPYFRFPKTLKVTERKTRFAVAAASMAMVDAALDSGNTDFESTGVVIGSGNVDLQIEDLALAIGPDLEGRSAREIPFFSQRVLAELNPLWLLISLPNMVSSHVSIQAQAFGPNSTIMTDWVAGAQAIGEGAAWIRSGEADVVLAGGADSGTSSVDLAGLAQLGILKDCAEESTAQKCVPGEGAAILVLEELSHARRRKARILGEITGYSTASLPIGNSSGGALRLTMARALRESGWKPGEVGSICTAMVDVPPFSLIEQAALQSLFQDSASRVPRVEFQSRLGYTFAAAAALDLALVLKSFSEGMLASPVLCNSLGMLGEAATLAVCLAQKE